MIGIKPLLLVTVLIVAFFQLAIFLITKSLARFLDSSAHQDSDEVTEEHVSKTIPLATASSALALSGGSTLAFAHLGIVKRFLENKSLPRIISGSSAGALIAAISTYVCVRVLHLMLVVVPSPMQSFWISCIRRAIFTSELSQSPCSSESSEFSGKAGF
jgi:hypothetical protein